MNSVVRRLLVVAGLMLPLTTFGAELTLYERESFGGRSFNATQTISNFANVGFNDRASSIIIRSGSWQLCTDAFFRGRCATLSRGEYPSLRAVGLEDQISSARELDWVGGGGGVPGGGGGGGSRAGIELYDQQGFRGSAYPVTAAISNFSDVGFNDRARSMVVYQGNWEACEHADFRGSCQTFAPGRYGDLGGFAGQISSIRPVGFAGPGPGGPGPGGGWGSGSRAILYEGQNLSGRSFVIDHEVATNLGNTGFNDRAASLRVEAGYWVFCSDANFNGECLTFGPGDYPTLPWGLAYKISSGRRINAAYPYNQSPSWSR